MGMQKSLSVRLHDLLKSTFEHSSCQLARFARKKSYMKNKYRVIKANDELYIGYMSDNNLLCGARLMRIACGNPNTFAFTGINTHEDVTEWFINEYKSKGMCAYSGDWNHAWNVDENHEIADGTVRTCKHCKKQETLKSKMVRKTWWSNV
jgi:hypothetical protein